MVVVVVVVVMVVESHFERFQIVSLKWLGWLVGWGGQAVLRRVKAQSNRC